MNYQLTIYYGEKIVYLSYITNSNIWEELRYGFLDVIYKGMLQGVDMRIQIKKVTEKAEQ